jgi:CXXX repeat modification system protein
MKKLVGKVTVEEKNEIQSLFERRNGLTELAKILSADNVELYEKLVRDMGETGVKFQGWWDRMAQQYNWESCEGGNWEINFESCEIFLVCRTCDCK